MYCSIQGAEKMKRYFDSISKPSYIFESVDSKIQKWFSEHPNLNAYDDEQLVDILIKLGASRSSAISKLNKRFNGRFGLKESELEEMASRDVEVKCQGCKTVEDAAKGFSIYFKKTISPDDVLSNARYPKNAFVYSPSSDKEQEGDIARVYYIKKA